MDIAAVSMGLSNNKLQTSVDIAVEKKAMDVSKSNNESMIQMMEQSVSPYLGRNLDVRI
ncbi:YjfB family protein [Aneurinibacillus sp. Ricciae_BoGa-3]|uniref:YjfB family protein n=1 Tax=Aneurinibacillus sp. Ricciae_BoGa-3 TaxID=3022697 RepID=UPI002341BBF3|nr:YjfB family protein [Aneurinibacillus sp. Ricciae_BoGa-3]WCK52810.1 YjfB family protein [Aneurinibacillus sp. Ricciae_BoGa-3]